MKATRVLQSTASTYLTYKLGKSLYVPLTSRCNSRTLPQLRGDGFILPAHVVSSLCRVRDLEMNTTQWVGWCNYLDTQEGGKFQLPPRSPPDHPDSEHELQQQSAAPSIEDLYREIQEYCSNVYKNWKGPQDRLESIVFSGEGEPTCRWNDLLKLASMIHNDDTIQQQTNQESGDSSPSIRLTTNGLIDPTTWIDPPHYDSKSSSSSSSSSSVSLPQQLYDAGINEVSVMLMTHDRDQYDELVHPHIMMIPPQPPAGSNQHQHDERAHDIVCKFITECVQVQGLDVEVTCVQQPPGVFIDETSTEALAVSLGVTKPIRWRPYFP